MAAIEGGHADRACRDAPRLDRGLSQTQGACMYQALTAGDLCTRETVCVPRTTSLTEAARLMRERHVGSLVIVDERPAGRVPAGVITDRDLVTAVLARDVDVHALRVEDVMSTAPIVVQEQASLFDALATMRSKGVRRLVVVDTQGLLQGVLALDDVIEVVAEQMQAVARALASGRPREQRGRP
jgi:CBS domain-containing protein